MSEDMYKNFTKEQLIALLIGKDRELKEERDDRREKEKGYNQSIGRSESMLIVRLRQIEKEKKNEVLEIESAYKDILRNKENDLSELNEKLAAKDIELTKEREHAKKFNELNVLLAAKDTELVKERERVKKLEELNVQLTAKATEPVKVTVANYLFSQLEFYEMSLGDFEKDDLDDLEVADDVDDDDISGVPINVDDDDINWLLKTHYVNWLNIFNFSIDARVKKIKTQIIPSLKYGDIYEFCMDMATLHYCLSKLININLTPMPDATFADEQQMENILSTWNIDDCCIFAAKALFRISKL